MVAARGGGNLRLDLSSGEPVSHGVTGRPPDDRASVTRVTPDSGPAATNSEPACEDEQLIDAACRGDQCAYAELARQWQRRLLAVCHARLPQLSDAEDAVQETLLRVWKHLPELRDRRRLAAWVRGIAVNACHDVWRARQRIESAHVALLRQRVQPANDSEAHPVPGVVAQREDERELWQAIRELEEPLREVILLHYFETMTYDQMASWIGVARATVQDRLSRARSQLRRRLNHLSPPPG